MKIKATIFYEAPYWVGSFERTDKEGYSIARVIFGQEPSDAEIHEYVLKNYQQLNFGEPRDFELKVKRLNPKRQQREIRKEMERLKLTQRPSTYAQDCMREDLEQNKKQRKKTTKAQKEAHLEKQYLLKQQKRKEKRRGH